MRTNRGSRRTFPFAATALVWSLGCGGAGAGQSPEATVAELGAALREQRLEDAYALMASSYRERVTLAEFRARLRAPREDLQAAAAALARPTGGAEVSASVELPDGERVELVREGGTWRIATNLIDFYDQSTPRAALRAFVRAMERERYDVVLRLVPHDAREGMTEERLREAFSGERREDIDRMIANLRAHLDRPIEETGNHATMAYGEHEEAVLVREDGVWKVDEPE